MRGSEEDYKQLGREKLSEDKPITDLDQLKKCQYIVDKAEAKRLIEQRLARYENSLIRDSAAGENLNNLLRYINGTPDEQINLNLSYRQYVKLLEAALGEGSKSYSDILSSTRVVMNPSENFSRELFRNEREIIQRHTMNRSRKVEVKRRSRNFSNIINGKVRVYGFATGMRAFLIGDVRVLGKVPGSRDGVQVPDYKPVGINHRTHLPIEEIQYDSRENKPRKDGPQKLEQ